MEPFLTANRDKLATLSDFLTLSCALLASEVVLWTLSITG